MSHRCKMDVQPFTKQHGYILPNRLGADDGADEGLLVLTNTCLVVSVAATDARLLAFDLRTISLSSSLTCFPVQDRFAKTTEPVSHI